MIRFNSGSGNSRIFKGIFSGSIISLMLLISGCGKTDNKTVKEIKIIQGANQCALPQTECKKPLKIELLGPKIKGFLGGKGTQHPVPGVKVIFEVQKGSDLTITCDNPVTNQGGNAYARIKTGSVIGDQYLKVIPEGFPKAAKTVRIISGIKVSGSKQEAFAETDLQDPIAITVYDKDNKPAEGVPVYFKLASTPEKKPKFKIDKPKVLTNAKGVAETACKMGTDTGTYKIIAEVSDPQRGIQARGIEIKQLGINLWHFKGLILTVLGGLAIFIYGMKLMTDGLQLVAGDKMKKILSFFTKNRFAAVAAGTAVTGVIQSSSACTVMVVGFVNAGLLNLQQAIGVVFGANIGTTITAQIISFKLGKLALPAITVGLIILMIAKRSSWKGWASTLMGFGMLFLGLGIMSAELKLIAKFPSIIHFFAKFDCSPAANGTAMPIGHVLGAILIGTAMTVLIQSSSATIGIALALAGSGLINFYTAVPLILGDNIGTTVTANLAALGANRRSKQTAFAHFLFNILGTTYMVALFYIHWPGTKDPFYLHLINKITPGNAFEGENVIRHIAMAHSMFNIFNVILFLPFIAYIAKLCNIVIPIKKGEKDQIQHLEPRLLDTPSIAIEQSIQSIRYMVKESLKMVTEAMLNSFMKGKTKDKQTADLNEREERIDQLQSDITKYLVQLTERTLTEHQAGIIPLLMHCTNDAERIADHTENIIALTKRLEESKSKLSNDAKAELENLWKFLQKQADYVIACINSTDKKEVNLALKSEIEIDKLADKLENSHVERLNKGKCNAITGIIYLEIINELEKVGDHLANIADRAKKIQKHHLELGS